MLETLEISVGPPTGSPEALNGLCSEQLRSQSGPTTLKYKTKERTISMLTLAAFNKRREGESETN